MLLFDATHTSHTQAQTGIQRVCRSLHSALAAREPVTAICHDPYFRGWRPLSEGEKRRLAPGLPAASSRGAKWPWHLRIAGHAKRLIGHRPELPPAHGVICPELFSPAVAASLPSLKKMGSGP